MIRLAISIVLAFLLGAPVVHAADEEDHAAHHPGAATDKAVSAQGDQPAEMKMQKMQERMKRMQEQMQKIRATTNPQERQKLMREHMQSMQEGMKMMGSMRGEMMGGDMMAKAGTDQGESMMEDGGKGTGGMGMMGGMMKKHMMMQGRMDMLEMMMQQMIDHEKVEQEIERSR